MIENVAEYGKLLFGALVGGLVVYIFGIRKLSVELRNDFIQKQLAEFYSPIAGYSKRIRAKSEVRTKVSALAGEAWRDICASYREANQIMHNHEELYQPYEKIIEYDNNQLLEEFMPLYRKVLDIFTDKYWLADSDTRTYYQEVLEFVEIWERSLAEALPFEVKRKIAHSETADKVTLFYEHIEQKLTFLQNEINTNSIWKLRF